MEKLNKEVVGDIETEETQADSNVVEKEVQEKVEQEVEEKELKLTQMELNNIVQKRIARDRATFRDEIKNELKAELEKEKEEAKRLATLSAEERLKEEKKIAESEAEKLRLEIKRRDLKEDTIARLHQEGLDIGFTEFVMTEEAESTNERIKALKELFNEAVQEEANQRFKRPSPRMGGSTLASDNPWRKETFNLTKQGQLLKNDPERAKVLMREAGR